jgi:hypothetical protein
MNKPETISNCLDMLLLTSALSILVSMPIMVGCSGVKGTARSQQLLRDTPAKSILTGNGSQTKESGQLIASGLQTNETFPNLFANSSQRIQLNNFMPAEGDR